MRTITRRTIAVLAVGGLLLSGAPTMAAATEELEGFYIGGGDGALISQSILAAIDEQGEEAVRTGLDALIHTAENGGSVDFPGLEGAEPASAAASLSSLKHAFLDGDNARSSAAPFVDWKAFGEGEVETAQARGVTDYYAPNPSFDPLGNIASYSDVRGGPLAGSTRRAWVMTAGLNVKHCNSSACTLVDRMELRVTVTPYEYRNRVEYWSTYPVQAEVGKNISINGRAVVREFYNYAAGSWDAPSITAGTPAKSGLFDSSGGVSHWVLGTTLIYGLQFKSGSVAGILEDTPRTSTATCRPSPSDYCAW